MKEEKTVSEALLGCQGIILSLFISMWLSGVVIQYGWNNIIVTIFEITKINFWQAVGLDLVVTLIVGSPLKPKVDKTATEIIVSILFWYAILFVLLWFVAGQL